jgi:hypothetical protein
MAVEMNVKLEWIAQPPAVTTIYQPFPSPVVIRYIQSEFWVRQSQYESLFFKFDLIPVNSQPVDPLQWRYDDENFMFNGYCYVDTDTCRGRNIVPFHGMFISVPGYYKLRVCVFLATQQVLHGPVTLHNGRLLGSLVSHIINARTFMESAPHGIQVPEVLPPILHSSAATPLGPVANQQSQYRCWRYCCHQPECHLCRHVL